MHGCYFIIICSFMLSACNYNVVKNPNVTGGNNSLSQPISESATIDAPLIQGTVLKQCMSCHAGRTAPELGSLTGTREHIAKILSEVLSDAMPPAKNGYAPLSDCGKAILQRWVDIGAPLNSSEKVGSLVVCKGQNSLPPDQSTIPISQLPVNYQTLLKKVLQPKCLKCHNPDSDDVDAAGILFYPFAEIAKKPNLWSRPGALSKIVRVLTRNNDERMPPPEEGPALEPEEINFIVKWIDAGSPEQ